MAPPRHPRKRGRNRTKSSGGTTGADENVLTESNSRISSSTVGLAATTGSGCDRRISRAAREIVRQHLVMTISKSTRIQKTAGPAGSDSFIGNVDGNHTDWNVWQLLELVFPERPNITSTCPTLLDPRRDVGRPHEEQSLVISYNQARKQAGIKLTASSSSGKALRSSAIPGMVHASKVGQVPSTKADLDGMSLHQCGFCGKMFLSRYYLDQHFDRRHSNASISMSPVNDAAHHVNSKESKPTPQELVCPADAWCHSILSRVACHEMALLLEPFYGPGSNGRGPDRRSVHRQWQRQVPACRTTELQQASQTCQSLLKCITSDASLSSENGEESEIPERASALQQHFVASLCREQTCQDLLHQSILGNKQRGYVSHNWHVDEWYQAFQTVEANHHRLGLGSVLLLLAIAIYYGSFYCYDWMFAPSSRRADPRALGLLRKQNIGGTSIASRRLATTSGAPITGRKQRPVLTSAPRPNTFVDVGPAKRKQN